MFSVRRFLQITSQTALLALFCSTAATAGAAECSDVEVGYIATFNVNPGSESAFEDAIATLADTVNRVETGVLLYAPYKGTEGRYYMMERYLDADVRKAHGTSAEVQALFPTLGPHLAGAPDVQPVSAVCR